MDNTIDFSSMTLFQDMVKRFDASKWPNTVEALNKISAPKKKRTIDPKAMEKTKTFVDKYAGLAVNADMYAAEEGITRELAQERLNSAKNKNLIQLHPASKSKMRYYIPVANIVVENK